MGNLVMGERGGKKILRKAGLPSGGKGYSIERFAERNMASPKGVDEPEYKKKGQEDEDASVRG